MPENDYAAPGFSLTDVFNTFARKAVADFPQLKGKFAFYSVPTDSSHGDANAHDEDMMIGALKRYIAKGDTAPAFAEVHAKGFYLMGWVENQGRTHTRLGDPLEREVRTILEHELGHLIAPGGSGVTAGGHGTNFRECVADAFTFIRQLQQGHDISLSIDITTHIAARNMLMQGNDSEHYTAPVLQELKRMAATEDIQSLTPVQSANLAYRLALQYAPAQSDLDGMMKIFAPVAATYATEGGFAALQQCALLMMDNYGGNSTLVYNGGRHALHPLLSGNADILSVEMSAEEIGTVKLEGQFWDIMRAGIQKRDEIGATETTEQKLQRECRDMMVTGRFDASPDAPIDVVNYESDKNSSYLKRAADAYLALRRAEIAGNAMPRSREENAAAARKTASGLSAKEKVFGFLRR